MSLKCPCYNIICNCRKICCNVKPLTRFSVRHESSKGLDKHKTFVSWLYRDSDMTARVYEMRATYATLVTLFLNKVALLAQYWALTKVSRQCIREGRLNSPLIPLPFENPSRPRLMNTNVMAFHFDYLILASCKKFKKKWKQKCEIK